MDDKTLFQNLINEIKNLNARGIADSKVLRDSLAQDTIISDGIKDLNKNISALNKKVKESSEKVEEHLYYTHLNSEHIEYNTKMAGLDISDIKKTIKDKFNSSEENNIDISIAADIEKLIGLVPALSASISGLTTTIVRTAEIHNTLIGSIDTLSRNIIQLSIPAAAPVASPTTAPNAPSPAVTSPTTAPSAPGAIPINTATNPITVPTPILPTNNTLDNDLERTKILSSIFQNIANVNSFAALKTSMVMPTIIKRIVTAMENFSSITALSSAARKTLSTFTHFVESLKIIAELSLGKFITNVFALGKIMPLITGLVNKFAFGLDNNALKKLENIQNKKSLESFVNLIYTLNNLSIGKLYATGKLLPGIIVKITESINSFAKNLKSTTLTKLNKIGDSLNPFIETLQNLGNIKLLKLVIFGKLLPGISLGLSKSIDLLGSIKSNSFKKIDQLKDSFIPFIDDLGKSFSKIGTSIIKMGVGIALLAGSLFIMSKVDAGNLLLVAGSTLAVAGAMNILSKINAGAALKGVGVIAVAGVAMAGLAFAMNMFNDVSLDSFLMSIGALGALTGAAVLLSKFASQAVIGAGVILALSAAMIPLAFSMQMLEGISWGTLGMAATALVGLAAAAFGLSFIAPAIFAGSLAIAALGASLLPLALSLNMLNSVDPGILLDIAKSLGIFTASILPLVLLSPLFAVLSLAMIPFTATLFALSKIGSGLSVTSDFFSNLRNFVKEVPADEIWSISNAIGALSAAMTAFAAADLGASLASAFSGLISFFTGGDSPIEKLKEIASLTALSDIGPAIKSLSEGLYNIGQLKSGAFAAINEFPWDKIQNIASELKEGATLQIIHVANGSDLRTTALEETGSKMNGTGSITVNNIVSNNGGNTTNTSIANSTTNLRSSPQVLAPRSQEF